MDKLGQEAEDKITGFRGIIIGKVYYLFGCAQYGIAPKMTKDGKSEDSKFFDEGRIKIIGPGITPKSVKGKKNGGVNIDAPKGV